MTPNPTSRRITACQICGADGLESVLFLGYVPPVNMMRELDSPAGEEVVYPLEMLRCQACGHAQIGLEVDQEVLFPYSYPYLSGTTRILRENFEQLCEESTEVLGLAAGDVVVDIGSNDGTLLAPFHARGHRVLGIEPTQAGEVARERGIETRTAYFDEALATEVRAELGPVKLVTAANVFAHIASPHDVVRAVVAMLADDGVFVSESHYLADLIETLQYDTIYHEHLRYYHLGALTRLFEPHGLEVFRVTRIPTHGGSIRVYAARKGAFPAHSSVAETLENERAAGLVDGSAFGPFRRRVLDSKLSLHALLAPIKARGERIYGIGAPSRASTLVSYTGLDDGTMDCVLEVSSSHKLDKYLPGTRIPVVDEARLFDDQPEYALLLSWHIADGLMKALAEKGYQGKFIVPLPGPRIVESGSPGSP